jgi:hypothetical protein
MNTETTQYLLSKTTQSLNQYCSFGGIDNQKLQLNQLQSWNIIFTHQVTEILLKTEGTNNKKAIQ